MRSLGSRAVLVRGTLLGCMVCAFVIAAAPAALAQSVTAGSIRGKVTDETGAALPGVTVTVTGQVLQSRPTSVTDGDGEYRFTDLPVGDYKLTFELAGFQGFIRDGIGLSANFTATINVEMKIGSLEETVVVSGQSPVVDVTSTTHAVRITGQYIADLLPGDRTMSDVMAVTPGVQITARPDMGRGREASSGSGRVFGTTGQVNPLVEGISTRQDANSPGNSPDLTTAAEVAIVSVAGGASQATPGVATNVVVKSGGNDFHGRYEASGLHERFQGNNLTDELVAQGITVGDNLILNREFNADLGGRIVRDKVWFYGAGTISTRRPTTWVLAGARRRRSIRHGRRRAGNQLDLQRQPDRQGHLSDLAALPAGRFLHPLLVVGPGTCRQPAQPAGIAPQLFLRSGSVER